MSSSQRPSELDGDWKLVKSVRNPWGQVPVTASGRSLPRRAQVYTERLAEKGGGRDTPSRRHHYVPRAYLRQWSADKKRVWSLDTVSGEVKQLGLSSVCAEENFYRVLGPDGNAHNRVELLFGVVDTELSRVQRLFNNLETTNDLEFDDLIGLGVSVAVQRMRTAQQRRLRRQHDAWLVAQNPKTFHSIESTADQPFREAGIHTELLFKAMWEAADVLTTRQIEVWHDAKGRFTTCDAPVLVPFQRNIRPSLVEAPYVIWPISPYRAIALSNDLQGEKAVIVKATGKQVGTARLAVEQGRERMIFAADSQKAALPRRRRFRRRAQCRFRCSTQTPQGEQIEPPGCCVEFSEVFDAKPIVELCRQGLHFPAPRMLMHV